jgi:putative oxidoreductase
MNTGLLVLRLVVGLLLVGHGSQKLFGRFGGHGLEGTGGWFHSVGFRPGKAMAFVAGAAELGAGLLLALGLLTPFAALAAIGTLVVAASVHVDKGLWGQNGGYELPLLYSVVAAALAFTGPGRYSLDNTFGIADDLSGTAVGIVVIAVSVLAALVVIARAKKTLAADAPAYPSDATASRTVDA